MKKYFLFFGWILFFTMFTFGRTVYSQTTYSDSIKANAEDTSALRDTNSSWRTKLFWASVGLGPTIAGHVKGFSGHYKVTYAWENSNICAKYSGGTSFEAYKDSISGVYSYSALSLLYGKHTTTQLIIARAGIGPSYILSSGDELRQRSAFGIDSELEIIFKANPFGLGIDMSFLLGTNNIHEFACHLNFIFGRLAP